MATWKMFTRMEEREERKKEKIKVNFRNITTNHIDFSGAQQTFRSHI